MHTALADDKCVWQVTFPVCESFRADCCSPKGPISVLKWQFPPESEIRLTFSVQRGYNTSLKYRFRFILLLIWYDIASNYCWATFWLILLGTSHLGSTSICRLYLLLCALHGKSLWTPKHNTHMWFLNVSPQNNNSLHPSEKAFNKIWNLIARICSHSETRALVGSGTDVGW